MTPSTILWIYLIGLNLFRQRSASSWQDADALKILDFWLSVADNIKITL